MKKKKLIKKLIKNWKNEKQSNQTDIQNWNKWKANFLILQPYYVDNEK